LPVIVGNSNSTLRILGRGTAELKVASPNFSGKVTIRGAQLTLSGSGRLNNAQSFAIENGGTLFLDNLATAQADRIGDFAQISLNAGTLHLRGRSAGSIAEQFGWVVIENGANTLQLTHEAGAGDFTALRMIAFQALSGTFNFAGNRRFGTNSDLNSVRLSFNPTFSPDISIGEVLLQATVNGEDWATTTQSSDGNVYFVAFEDYYTGSLYPWDVSPSDHALVDGYTESISIGQPLQIASLKLANGGSLAVWGSDVVERNFRGILTTGNWDNRIGGIGPFNFEYAHIYSPSLSFEGWTRLATSRLIKTGPGTLRFATVVNSQYHQANSLTIYQGKVAVESGKLLSRNIVVGDRAGTDILELPENHLNPIEGLGIAEEPDPRLYLTLRGPTSGDPDSGEADAAILRFGGDTRQDVYEFRVEGRGTIDFVGGTQLRPNAFFIEEFFLANDATLFIRNWEDGADLLLVRHSAANIARIDAAFLSRIYFEHYGSPGAVWEYWSDEYWQIKPFPEPTTYGAIFGVIGLGVFTWRRRRRASRSATDVAARTLRQNRNSH